MALDSNNPNTSAALKQSFFKEYFFHKLRGLKGFNITFLVMNLVITVVFALMVLVSCIEFKNFELNSGSRFYLFSIFSYYMDAMIYLVFIAENFLIMIMAAVNMKFCHNRSVMDTVGGLPLTVSQRFFGDFLSGLSSFAPTFFIGSIPALIMMAVIQFGVSPEYQAGKLAQGLSRIYIAEFIEDKFVLLGFLALVTMFLCLAASYTIACFVTSCSGKLNSSVIFTFIISIALPVIAVSYGGFVVKNSIGVVDEEYISLINMLPPIGTISYLFYSFVHDLLNNYRFAAASPQIIVMLAVVIFPAVGAYLISKKRKAEKVDKPFIYKPLYMAATFVLSVTSCGLMLNTLDSPGFIIPVLIFTVAACLFIEYAGSHSKRTCWKGLVRFVVSAVVCAVFGVIAYNTNGFNIGKRLPNEKQIRSVFINSSYLQNHGYSYEVYDEPAIISAVLSEHKKIIDNLDEFPRVDITSTWSSSETDFLVIEYYMSDRSEIIRRYYGAKELIDNFGKTLLEMPEIFNKTSLGVLNFPCEGIEYSDHSGGNRESYSIKPSKLYEFIECLRSDLLNRPVNYRDSHTGSFDRFIYYEYTDASGRSREQTITIYDIDKKTLAFLNDPDNLSTEVRNEFDYNAYYTVYYYADGMKISVNDATISFGFDPDTPAKRELVSYFETEYTATDEFSDKFSVKVDGKTLKVKPENEQAVFSALIAIIKEQVSGGNIS